MLGVFVTQEPRPMTRKAGTPKPFTRETFQQFNGFKTSDGGLFDTAPKAAKRQNEINFERMIMGLMDYVDLNDGDYNIATMISYLRNNRQEIIRLLYEDANNQGVSDPFASQAVIHETVGENGFIQREKEVIKERRKSVDVEELAADAFHTAFFYRGKDICHNAFEEYWNVKHKELLAKFQIDEDSTTEEVVIVAMNLGDE
jgi:hypothetical protein